MYTSLEQEPEINYSIEDLTGEIYLKNIDSVIDFKLVQSKVNPKEYFICKNSNSVNNNTAIFDLNCDGVINCQDCKIINNAVNINNNVSNNQNFITSLIASDVLK